MNKKQVWITGLGVLVGAVTSAQSVGEMYSQLAAPSQEVTVKTVAAPVEKPAAPDLSPQPVVEAAVPVTVDPTPAKVVADDSTMTIGGAAPDLANKTDSGLISFSFENRAISEVIRDFSLLSGANIIVPDLGPEILSKKTSIALNFELADWKANMQAVLDSHNLELYETVPGSEVYTVRVKALSEGIPKKTQTIILNHADVDATQKMIAGFLGANGSVQGYASGNALVVSAPAEMLEDVKRIVEKIDVPRQQVLIEARIFELSKTGDDEVGSQMNFDNILSGTATAINPMKGLAPFDSALNLAESKPVSLKLDYEGVKLAIAALQAKGNVKTVSSPKVIVENGRQAKINILNKVPRVTRTLTETESSSGAITKMVTAAQDEDGTDPDTLQKRFVTYDFGIRLEVTPTIYTEDNIAVDITPIITREDQEHTVTAYVGDDPVTGDPISDKYYAIDEKRVNTTFMLANGETAVIGGLTTTKDSEAEKKVPFLGSIPLIRHLFTYRHAVKEQIEDVIFVTVSLEKGKDFDMAKAVKKSPLTRKQLIRDESLQKVQDREIELYDASQPKRVSEDVKEVERQDQIERREINTRKPFWYFLRPGASPRWSPL